uniref:Uncharacterized protein n=1 Tax=Ditylenchus dipsaci TaxID=166011 RepID=A0A915DNK8_9BILA
MYSLPIHGFFIHLRDYELEQANEPNFENFWRDFKGALQNGSLYDGQLRVGAPVALLAVEKLLKERGISTEKLIIPLTAAELSQYESSLTTPDLIDAVVDQSTAASSNTSDLSVMSRKI